MYLLVIDNAFNRHWYKDLIGRVYTPSEQPAPYAHLAIFNCYIRKGIKNDYSKGEAYSEQSHKK